MPINIAVLKGLKTNDIYNRKRRRTILATNHPILIYA
jgi:hypothetical protein